MLPKILRIVFYPSAIAVIGLLVYWHNSRTPEAIIQPVRFNHKLHTEDLRLECTTCHPYVTTEEFAGRPSMALCATCHAGPDADDAELAREPRQFITQETCKLCHNQTEHGTQWDIWKASPHAKAYQTLLEEPSLEIARGMGLDRPPSEAPECLRCHATEYDRKTRSVPDPLKLEDGVQCEACHGMGSGHVADGRRHWLSEDLGVDFTSNIQRPNERTCRQCHRRQSPTWDPKRYTENGKPTGFSFQQAFAKTAHPLERRFQEDFTAPGRPNPVNDEVTKVTDHIASGKDIGWRRIYDVPSHVYYSHRRHVTVAGIECDTCHGNIGASAVPPEAPLNDISMAFCIDCHEEEDVTTDCNACHR